MTLVLYHSNSKKTNTGRFLVVEKKVRGDKDSNDGDWPLSNLLDCLDPIVEIQGPKPKDLAFQGIRVRC